MNSERPSAAIAQPTGSSLEPEHRRVIFVLIAGVFLPLLDATVVNIAIQEMAHALGASLALIQWVVTAYTLSAAAVVPISAWAANRWGAKRVWIAGLVIFLLGSILASAARSAFALVVFRVIQGAGAGLMMPVMQTVLIQSVGQHNAKSAMASMAIPSVMAPIFGPVAGGFVLHYAGWRYIFLFNVPLCLIAIYLAIKHLVRDKNLSSLPFDILGFMLLCPGIVLIVYGLSAWAHYHARVMLLAGAALGLAFMVHAKRGRSRALIDITLFSLPSFRSSSWLLMGSSMAFYGGLLILPLYFFQQCQLDVIEASILLAFQGIGTMLSRRYLESLSQRWGLSKLAVVSAVLTLCGSAALLFPQTSTHVLLLLVCMLVRGAGLGLLTIIALSTAYRDVDRARIADASAVTRILTHLAAALGSASVLGVLQAGAGIDLPGFIGSSGFTLAFAFLMILSAACIIPASRLGT